MSEPPSTEESVRARAFAGLALEVEAGRQRMQEMQRRTNPISRMWLTVEYFVTDLRAAYAHSQAHGTLGAGWWLFGALLVLTLILFGAFATQVPGVPYWAWLASWGLAVVVAYWLIRQHARRGPFNRVR